MPALQLPDYHSVSQRLLDWMVDEDFLGYDPYDGCNTSYSALRAHRWTRLAATYAHKFSPVNLRPLTGVQKHTNVYGLSLVVCGILAKPTQSERSRVVVNRLINIILLKSLYAKYGYHCWSANGIYIQTTGTFYTPDLADVVGTEQCVQALIAHAGSGVLGADHSAMLASARDFCLNVLLERKSGRTFFRYKPNADPGQCTLNASMRAATIIAEVNRCLGESVGDDASRECIHYLISLQRDDGAWNYSIHFSTGLQKQQIDFHQGFMLDGLFSYLDVYGEDSAVNEALERGLRFFREVQFSPEGQGYYRFPRRWPANIHNQAQGILTFVRAEERFPGSIEHAHRVAAWTLDNMLDRKGTFHYLKYRGFSNRIPYLRWAQAWMFLALRRLAVAGGVSPRGG